MKKKAKKSKKNAEFCEKSEKKRKKVHFHLTFAVFFGIMMYVMTRVVDRSQLNLKKRKGI